MKNALNSKQAHFVSPKNLCTSNRRVELTSHKKHALLRACQVSYIFGKLGLKSNVFEFKRKTNTLCDLWPLFHFRAIAFAHQQKKKIQSLLEDRQSVFDAQDPLISSYSTHTLENRVKGWWPLVKEAILKMHFERTKQQERPLTLMAWSSSCQRHNIIYRRSC